ncbi:receptor-like protein EIX1 [Benincasa hispida]|uniref:receptor-like protein EIX1 n=1 Tax=Benincasa hispida TaxID=102211 RepID=UPI0018FFFAC7|nr:receptor-like protein EIX1 [Benincasa hispida]
MATKGMGKRNASHAACIEIEREALLKFKEVLVDPSNRLSSWLVGTDCCKWAAIRCDSLTGHVKQLNLGNRFVNWNTLKEMNSFLNDKLKGSLSDSILNLSHISRIDLSYNDFGGIPIPSFFGSLTSLNYLNLTSSGFQGLVPYQLGNLSNLQYLSLRGNFRFLDDAKLLYSENLQWLQGLRSLLSLDLSQVNLSKVSNWLLEINKLPYLVELHMSGCELNHITPLSQVNFTSLSIFDISYNNFGLFSIPKWMSTVGSLVSIDLSGCDFLGSFPKGFSNLTSLESLILQYNNLNSTLPEWLFSLPKISYLDLRSNNFEGPIPNNFQTLSTVTYLDLSFNNFTSTSIPTSFYSFHNLQYLYLISLDLQGEISPHIANLTNLVLIDLSNNKLEGSTPKSMGSLCNLNTIYLYQNNFNRKLSEFFDSFSGCLANSLMNLDLSRNNISGHLTNNLPKLRSLRYLDLSNNFISGPIPESIQNLGSMSFLDLAENKLNGSLPKSLGSMSRLQTLSISNNCMEGMVSEVSFANLVNLIDLDLSGNNLTLNFSNGWSPPFKLYRLHLRSCNLGPQFPIWIKPQNMVFSIDLSNTGISGMVPHMFWSFPNPNFSSSYLNLSHNQLSGRVPSFVLTFSNIYLASNKFHGSLPRISSNVLEFDLSNNSFSGNLDHFLCHSRETNQLNLLFLGHNRLSGRIPDCWSKWTSLMLVKLNNNDLSGNLPNSMGSLTQLMSLNLRNNNLIGEISSHSPLQKCFQLMSLDLGFNAFRGSIPPWIGTNLSNLVLLGLRSNQFSGLIPHQLCNLSSLQILDIGNNNLTGQIPHCFGNFPVMATEWRFSSQIFYYVSGSSFEVFEQAFVTTKGKEFEYQKILGLMTSMDLSYNNLSGEIPEEITALFGLISLNLSGNNLRGNIPQHIGTMKSIESLDLSRNQLWGQIPQSMSNLTFLSYLNLSYNNLSGQIPSSTQLQRLDPSSFLGNHLCGPPLINSCQMEGNTPNVETGEPKDEGDENHIIDEWFYLSIALGFIFGFWGIWVPLLISKTWRHAYFRHLTFICHRLN